MDPTKRADTYMTAAGSVNSADTAQATEDTHPFDPVHSLTLAVLSHHSLDALDIKEAQGTDQEKMLAGFARNAIAGKV